MRARVRLNIVLFGVIILTTVGAALLAVNMPDAHESKGGDTSGNWIARAWAVVIDKQSEGATSLVGADVGPGLVQGVKPADDEEQARWAEILHAATEMADVFLDIDYKNLDATREEVVERATGAFKTQYQKSFDALTRFTARYKSVQTGEVGWAGISSADSDSATVILAANTEVVNVNSTTPQAKAYRMQIELELQDGAWLTRDLRFIDATAPDQPAPQGDGAGDDTREDEEAGR